MNLSEVDVRIAQQRYDQLRQQARLLNLIRDLQAQRRPTAKPHRPSTLVARVWSVLYLRGAERAWR